MSKQPAPERPGDPPKPQPEPKPAPIKDPPTQPDVVPPKPRPKIDAYVTGPSTRSPPAPASHSP
jgi:hypothetical protein